MGQENREADLRVRRLAALGTLGIVTACGSDRADSPASSITASSTAPAIPRTVIIDQTYYTQGVTVAEMEELRRDLDRKHCAQPTVLGVRWTFAPIGDLAPVPFGIDYCTDVLLGPLTAELTR